MKKTFVAVSVLVMVLGLVGITGRANAQNALVAYWPFNETSGTILNDSSGNGNTAYNQGAIRVPGVSSNALSFYGSGVFAYANNSASLSISNKLTIECWVNVPTITYTNQTIIRKNNAYVFGIGGHGYIGFYIVDQNDTYNGSWALSSQQLLSSTWYFIAGVWDGQTMKVYVNGVQDPAIYTYHGNGGPSASYTDAVYIGENPNGIQEFLNGTLDELKVYNYVLSSDTIFAHWSTTSSSIVDTSFGFWVRTSGPFQNGFINALAVNGSNLFAGTGNGGVFLSTDNGINWSRANNGLTNDTVNVLAVSGGNIFAGTNGGIFRSKNNGTSWTAVNTGLTNSSVNALAENGSNIFAGTNGGGVFRSTDSGNHWTAVNSGLTNTSIIWSLLVNGPNIFAGMPDNYGNYPAFSGCAGGSSHSVYASTDNGTSWNLDICGFPFFCGCPGSPGCQLISQGVKSFAVMGNDLFAGTNGSGVCLSTNSGTSCWTQVNSGLPSGQQVNALVGNDSDLFAGTNGGVYSSTDSGRTWNGFSAGLTDLKICSFAVGGNYLFAGTDYSGVWRRMLSQPSTAIKQQITTTEQFSFKLLTRNHSNPNVTFVFFLSRLEPVKLNIYNISGHLITTLIDNPLDEGQHRVAWNTKDIASGCYLVKMEAGTNTQVKSIPLFR